MSDEEVHLTDCLIQAKAKNVPANAHCTISFNFIVQNSIQDGYAASIIGMGLSV